MKETCSMLVKEYAIINEYQKKILRIARKVSKLSILNVWKNQMQDYKIQDCMIRHFFGRKTLIRPFK